MYRGGVRHCDLVNPGPITWSKILPLALLGSPNIWGKVFIQMLFYFGGWISMQEIETTTQVFMHKNNPWLGLLGVLVSPCFSFFLLALFNLALNNLFPRCYLVSALVGCTVGLCLLMELSQEKSALSTLSGAVTYWFLCPNQNVCAWNLFTKGTKPRKFSYEANHCHQVGKLFTCMLWWM